MVADEGDDPVDALFDVDDERPEWTTEEILAIWEKFFSDEGYMPLIEQVANTFPDVRSLEVEWSVVDRHNCVFAEALLKYPERFLYAANKAAYNLCPPDEKHNITVRVAGLPDAAGIQIRNIRESHVDSFISIRGVVRKVTEVRPQCVVGVFQCSRCGSLQRVVQEGGTIKEPLECSRDDVAYLSEPGCGRSMRDTHFVLRRRESEFVDFQKAEVQEPPEGLAGGAQPERLTVHLWLDLVAGVLPGDRVTLNGVLVARPRRKGKELSTVFDIHLECNSVEMEQQAYEEVVIDGGDLAEIEEIAKSDNLFERLISSVAPTIFGMDVEKKALILQMFGGVAKDMDDETHIRGDIHILLIGDPGVAKSQLLSYMSRLSPRGVYASGGGASAAGLTAAAVKTEFGDGRWELEAGALVLADRGLACVDEMDKMDKKDRESMHEAMEQQRVSIAKAGITAQLMSRCSVLAAANPKLGRFDEFGSIPEQINLPPALISRFDVIFPITDKPNEARDSELSRHILQIHRRGERMSAGQEMPLDEADGVGDAIEIGLLRKYVAHAKRSVHPIMSDDAEARMQRFYLQLRKEGGEAGAVSATPRQLEGLIRLSEASARARFSDVVDGNDVGRATDVVDYYLHMVAGDGVGGIDVDKITVGITRKGQVKAKQVLAFLEDENRPMDPGTIGEGMNVPEEDVRKSLEALSSQGLIYCPSFGMYMAVSQSRG